MPLILALVNGRIRSNCLGVGRESVNDGALEGWGMEEEVERSLNRTTGRGSRMAISVGGRSFTWSEAARHKTGITDPKERQQIFQTRT